MIQGFRKNPNLIASNSNTHKKQTLILFILMSFSLDLCSWATHKNKYTNEQLAAK